MSRNDSRNAKKEDAGRRRFWGFAQLIIGGWIRRKFGFSCDDFEPAEIKGPLLVTINHASAYDPIFVGAVFRNKPLTFIASEHILRSKWGPFLDKYLSILPHRKGAPGSRTALIAMKRMKKGESVFLAAEGEQTWNGRPMPVMPYTGRLARASGATLVTYVIEGAYLSAPRWAMNTRKGKVYGRLAGVYSPEELKAMSDEEVEKVIARDLAFDIWEWQKTSPEGPVKYRCSKGGFADGLERLVFTCPECGSVGTLKSKGDSISCSCGFRLRMLDTGFFEEGTPFGTIPDWEEYDRKTLESMLKEMMKANADDKDSGAAGEDTVFTDDGVVLHRILDGHSDEEAARGELSLIFKDGEFRLCIGDFSFDLRKISSMTMILAGRIVFSDDSGYYELLSNKKNRTNLIKYVIARELLVKE